MLMSRFLRYQSSSESVLRPQSVELLAPSGTDESVGHAALARQLQLQVVSLGLVCDGNRESDVRLDATYSGDGVPRAPGVRAHRQLWKRERRLERTSLAARCVLMCYERGHPILGVRAPMLRQLSESGFENSSHRGSGTTK